MVLIMISTSYKKVSPDPVGKYFFIDRVFLSGLPSIMGEIWVSFFWKKSLGDLVDGPETLKVNVWRMG
jgi:hypothetical protein